MGRWRPPAPKSSPYITPDGFVALQEELEGIWLLRRDVVKALAAAAAEGDRSENAEYIYRKKELAGLDRRIRYLQKRLPDLTVVHETHGGDAVYFGATVELVDDDDTTRRYCEILANATDADVIETVVMDGERIMGLSNRLGEPVGELLECLRGKQ